MLSEMLSGMPVCWVRVGPVSIITFPEMLRLGLDPGGDAGGRVGLVECIY